MWYLYSSDVYRYFSRRDYGQSYGHESPVWWFPEKLLLLTRPPSCAVPRRHTLSGLRGGVNTYRRFGFNYDLTVSRITAIGIGPRGTRAIICCSVDVNNWSVVEVIVADCALFSPPSFRRWKLFARFTRENVSINVTETEVRINSFFVF